LKGLELLALKLSAQVTAMPTLWFLSVLWQHQLPVSISLQHLGAEFTFGGSGPALTAHGSLDHNQEIQFKFKLQWPARL
jgi:hypothetical protein